MRIIAIISILISFCFSQLEAKRIPGYYITNSKEKVTVDFDVKMDFFSGDIDYSKIQDKIKYFDSNDKKQTLRPDMVSEFAIQLYNDPIVFLSRKNTVGAGSLFSGNYIFLRLLRDGKLKLFKVYEKQSSPGIYNSTSNMMIGGSTQTVEKYILQKGEGELFMINLITFRKKVSEYLSDCPDLVSKIQDKQYHMQDMARIVDEYNTNCK